MAQNDEGMAKGVIVGFIAGSIVGAVLALLYAPKPGRDLRAELKTKAGDMMNDAEQVIARARVKASEIVNEGKKRSESMLNDVRKRADSIMGDAERILSDARGKSGGEGARNS